MSTAPSMSALALTLISEIKSLESGINDGGAFGVVLANLRSAESAAYGLVLTEAQRIVHEECVAAMGAAPTYLQVGYRIECRLLALAKAGASNG